MSDARVPKVGDKVVMHIGSKCRPCEVIDLARSKEGDVSHVLVRYSKLGFVRQEWEPVLGYSISYREARDAS